MRPARVPILALLAVAVACEPADADRAEGPPDAVTADPDHYSVEFENDLVRILRIAYGPGETSVMHRHPPSCVVLLDDQPVTFELPSGEVQEPEAGETGQVTCTEGEVHLPTNTGDGEMEAVLVELKEGAGSPAAQSSTSAAAAGDEEHPDAVTADPDHYTVEFENELVRLVRIAYEPGETSVMHRHPASCAIFIQDQPTRMESPGGEVEEPQPAEPGQVACSDGSAHLPTNVGDGNLELILVEFKGRDTLEG